MFFAREEKFQRVRYAASDYNYSPRLHEGDGKVSYVLREEDPRKCHMSFFIITKWGHKLVQKGEVTLTCEKQAL